MEEKKGSWGGSRKGAGRKINESGEKKRGYRFTIRQDVFKTLQTLDNYSAFVEEAILKEFKRKKIKLEGTKKDAD